VYMLKAEFEPARAAAAQAGVPVRDVLRLVEEAAWERVNAGRVQSPQ